MHTALLALGDAPAGSGLAEIFAYPTATGTGAIPLSTQWTMSVNGTTIPVLHRWQCTAHDFPFDPAANRTEASVAIFDAGTGTLDFTLTCNFTTVTSVEILPIEKAISFSRVGNVITFSVPSTPEAYDIVVNGLDDKWFTIVVKAPWTGQVAPGTPGAHFYTPGVITKNGSATIHVLPAGGVYRMGTAGDETFNLVDGETLVIEPGAVLAGKVAQLNGKTNTTPVHDLTIDGRGWINSAGIADHAGSPIFLHDVYDSTITGVNCWDSAGFIVLLSHCSNITVADLFLDGHRQNTDGIDLGSCHFVTVDRCHVRNSDDGTCLKSFGDAQDPGGTAVPTPRLYTNDQNGCENITIQDCSFHTEVGNGSLEMGYRANNASWFRNITYRRISSRRSWHKHGISVHITRSNGSTQEPAIQNILYEDIYIHEIQGTLDPTGGTPHNIGLELTSDCDASINGVTFRRVRIIGPSVTSFLKSSNGNQITGVTAEQCTNNGVLIDADADWSLTRTNAAAITYT